MEKRVSELQSNLGPKRLKGLKRKKAVKRLDTDSQMTKRSTSAPI